METAGPKCMYIICMYMHISLHMTGIFSICMAVVPVDAALIMVVVN